MAIRRQVEKWYFEEPDETDSDSCGYDSVYSFDDKVRFPNGHA